MIKISEIFGPVIQGEGMHIGVPTVFVRTGGCDYRCSWCDTMYAVDKKFSGEWRSMDENEVVAAIQAKSELPILVTLSGGNPALFDFSTVIKRLHEGRYTVTIETQGSVPRSWFSLLDSITLSPKPPSSGMTTDFTKLSECMNGSTPNKLSLKIVVADDADYEYAYRVAHFFPAVRCFLQVCNPNPSTDAAVDRADLLARLVWLSDKVLADNWFNATVLPQLHVLMYGNKRGI
jgi:7-carboxy-7-deazaguanine synthase